MAIRSLIGNLIVRIHPDDRANHLHCLNAVIRYFEKRHDLLLARFDIVINPATQNRKFAINYF